MKRLLLSLITVTMILACGSHKVNAQFRYGATVGADMTDIHFRQTLAGVKKGIGAQAGAQAELMFPGIGFGLDFGLLYNMSAGKINLGDKLIWASQGYGNEHIYLHYIQVPLHLRFKWTRMNGIEDTWAPFVFGGPEFMILAAHSKCNAIDFRRAQLGLSAGVGFEILKRWQITGSFTWGLSDALETKLLDDYSAATRQWSVRLTYFF